VSVAAAARPESSLTALPSERRSVQRQRLIEQYLPLADKIARRYTHTSEPLDDLKQVARLGLVKAADRWDPGRGNTFSTFAVPTITGELRRYFRDRTWTVRPPRDLQDLYLDVQRVRQALATELGREPTARDVADRLGRTAEEIVEAVEAGDAHSPTSLDAPAEFAHEDGFSRLDTLADRRREISRSEDRAALEQLGHVLSDRDWEVVRLRFQEDLLQREIAERMGVSQMQVSRILRDSIGRLRAAADETRALFD
jgi:RNA polymerase sigma-B factor